MSDQMNFNNMNQIKHENPIVYKYLSRNNGLRVLLKKTLKFSRPYEFNDPFDCYEELIKFDLTQEFINEHIRKGILVLDEYQKSLSNEELLQQLQKEVYTFENDDVTGVFKNLFDKIRISCFSKTYNDILMWSHYGDKHEGICIGFNYQGLRKTFGFLPVNVEYKCKFDKVDYCNDELRAQKYFISTKSSHWEYEQEVRLMTRFEDAPGLTETGIMPIHPNSISEIVLGCNCAVRIDTFRQRIEKYGFKDVKIIKLVKSKNSFGFNETAI